MPDRERAEILLLPGLLCDAAVWRGQLEPLGALGHCSVADYRELDSLAAMARAVLDSAPPEFALVAHSMGGRVALEVLRAAPDKVRALALLDTGYQAREPGVAGQRETEQRMRLVALAHAEGMRAMGEQWLPGMIHPARLDDTLLVNEILAMIERRTPAIYAAQVRALLDRPDATALLPQIRCPTLLVCGAEDAWSPLSRHETMAAMIAGARLEVIADCGHMSTMERPAEVSRALVGWLAPILGMA